MLLLYGKPLAGKVQNAILRRVKKMRHKPSLAVVLVGSNHASVNYVSRKGVAAQSVGCGFTAHRLPASTSPSHIISLIKKLNNDKNVNGIIIQLPLPAKFDTEKTLSAIAPRKDVDNLRGDSPFTAPAVQAIWHMLHEARATKKSASLLIVGYGRLIGKPLHAFLRTQKFANITIADKTTKNLSTLTAQADIIISAVGKPGLITKIKKGTIIIDAGSGLQKGKIKGDVDVASVSKFAKVVTPVPGGVGPLTVAYLFKNLLSAK